MIWISFHSTWSETKSSSNRNRVDSERIFLAVLVFCDGMGSFLNWYLHDQAKNKQIFLLSIAFELELELELDSNSDLESDSDLDSVSLPLAFLSANRSSFSVYFCFPDSLYSIVLVSFQKVQFIGIAKGWFEPKVKLVAHFQENEIVVSWLHPSMIPKSV